MTERDRMTKKQSSGYYIGRMVLISLISLRRLLRQRGFVSFRLLFLATAQRVSRCSLPSLWGRGWGEGLFFVITYSVHYIIMASASFCLSFWLLLCKLFLSYYHFVDKRLNRGGGISSLFVSHF